MNTTILDVLDTETIVLTLNGKVVGLVRVEHSPDHIRFKGTAINIQNFKTHQFTANGFGCTSSMTTENPAEIASAGAFLEALKVSN